MGEIRLVVTLCLLLNSCARRTSVLPYSFKLKEKASFYLLDASDKSEFAYIFEKYSWQKTDSHVVINAILYRDIVLTSNNGDTLKPGEANVNILLLEDKKGGPLRLVEKLGKTNCYGGFTLNINYRANKHLFLYFIKDSTFNVCYDFNKISSSLPSISQENTYKIDSLCPLK